MQNNIDFNPNDVKYFDDNGAEISYEQLKEKYHNADQLQLQVGDWVKIKGKEEPVMIKYINYKVNNDFVVDYAGVLSEYDIDLLLFNSYNIDYKLEDVEILTK